MHCIMYTITLRNKSIYVPPPPPSPKPHPVTPPLVTPDFDHYWTLLFDSYTLYSMRPHHRISHHYLARRSVVKQYLWVYISKSSDADEMNINKSFTGVPPGVTCRIPAYRPRCYPVRLSVKSAPIFRLI